MASNEVEGRILALVGTTASHRELLRRSLSLPRFASAHSRQRRIDDVNYAIFKLLQRGVLAKCAAGTLFRVRK